MQQSWNQHESYLFPVEHSWKSERPPLVVPGRCIGAGSNRHFYPLRHIQRVGVSVAAQVLDGRGRVVKR